MEEQVEKKDKVESKDKSLEDKRKSIESQLENALKKREEYTNLIYKCQGALEFLDSMEKDDD